MTVSTGRTGDEVPPRAGSRVGGQQILMLKAVLRADVVYCSQESGNLLRTCLLHFQELCPRPLSAVHYTSHEKSLAGLGS